jgi:hypothetical protein
MQEYSAAATHLTPCIIMPKAAKKSKSQRTAYERERDRLQGLLRARLKPAALTTVGVKGVRSWSNYDLEQAVKLDNIEQIELYLGTKFKPTKTSRRQSMPASPVAPPKRKRAVSPTFDDDDESGHESGDQTEEESEDTVWAQVQAQTPALLIELRSMWEPIFQRLTSDDPLEDILFKDAAFQERYVDFIEKFYELPWVREFLANPKYNSFKLPPRADMLEDMFVHMSVHMKAWARSSTTDDHPYEMKLAASRGASGVAVLYNRRMCGLRDNEETRRELRMHGHVPDAVFRAEGMNYVGKATAVMEPTGKRWGRGPTRILNRSEEWMSDPGAVENAATHVESRRHKRHCSNNAERSREGKITSFNTAIYDDFCADSCIAQHLKLTDLAVRLERVY